jgi:hypothetical protein
MKTYGARVRVPAGSGTKLEWVEINAASPIAAMNLLRALYGRGNVVGVPILIT